MSTAKSAIVGGVLAVSVGIAVSTVIAQAPPDEQVRRRPRVMMLDGRGAQIGVSVNDVAEGVRIEEVDQNSPASRAGLKAGDMVVDVDGERVRSARQFSRLIQEAPDGRAVTLGVRRDGTRQTIDVTPESRTSDFWFNGDLVGREVERSMRALEPRLKEFNFHFDGMPRLTSPRARLGVQLNELTPELAQYFGAKEGGVLVASVTKDSAAEKAGLKAGDVITSVDGDPIRNTNDLVDELRDKDGAITLGIVRDKKESSVNATIATATPRPGFRRPV